LDDRYGGYRLLFKDINNEIINPIDLEYLLHFKGTNGDKKGNIYDIKIVGDGGGEGAEAHCDFVKGEGAEIMGVMRLEELTLNDMDFTSNERITLGFSIENSVLNLYDSKTNAISSSSNFVPSEEDNCLTSNISVSLYSLNKSTSLTITSREADGCSSEKPSNNEKSSSHKYSPQFLQWIIPSFASPPYRDIIELNDALLL